jgi:transcriptional regulator with XRE-family HTH domain
MRRKIEPYTLPFPAMTAVEKLGRAVSIARRQRRWTQADLAAKADVGLGTVIAIEKGSPSVQMGHWLKVLWSVDQLSRLEKWLTDEQDALGVGLMVEALPKRVRSGVAGRLK